MTYQSASLWKTNEWRVFTMPKPRVADPIEETRARYRPDRITTLHLAILRLMVGSFSISATPAWRGHISHAVKKRK